MNNNNNTPKEKQMKKRRSQDAIVRRYMKKHPLATMEDFKKKFPELDVTKYEDAYPTLKSINWLEVW